jgi:DNA repair protein RecO (recombination protein O)
MSLVTTRAVLLRSHPYSETSQVLRFYTESLGSLGVMGRGVRAGSGRGGSALDTFAEGTLSVHVKSTLELQTLKEFIPMHPRRGLAADVRRFGGAAVLAELVLRHALEEASPALFDALSEGLDRLERASGEEVVPVVLQEAWRVVSALGYRPILDECVECGRPFGDELARFDLAAGGLRCARCAADRGGPRLGPGARAQLEALLEREPLPHLDRPRAHLRLLSDFVTYHVGVGRPLPSLQVLVDLLGDPSIASPPPLAPRSGGYGA